MGTVNTKYHNLGFTRGFDNIVHVTPQGGPDRTVDTASGELTHVTRNEGSITLVPGTKPILIGNNLDEKHSKVGHEISTGNTEGDTIYTQDVLPPRIINTEVNNCNSVSGFNTKRCNVQFIDGVGFINRNKDTQDSYCQ